MKNKRIVFSSILVLIILFVSSIYFYNKNESTKLSTLSKEQSKLFKRDYSFTIGNDNAKVQLVEFFDPACETCADFHPYIKQILKEHKDDIQLVLRYAPLHKGSYTVVSILEATKKQDMFLETLDMMFKSQPYWASHVSPNFNVLSKNIENMGIDMKQLLIDMKDPIVERRINQDIADGKILGASKTPSYYVNGRPLQQFGLEQLKSLINEELNK